MLPVSQYTKSVTPVKTRARILFATAPRIIPPMKDHKVRSFKIRSTERPIFGKNRKCLHVFPQQLDKKRPKLSDFHRPTSCSYLIRLTKGNEIGIIVKAMMTLFFKDVCAAIPDTFAVGVKEEAINFIFTTKVCSIEHGLDPAMSAIRSICNHPKPLTYSNLPVNVKSSNCPFIMNTILLFLLRSLFGTFLHVR